ncbi:MAG: biotin--[acetyl-CoA-carboxylase] ligase [Candidatus Didemnitutus sp.]|nr:biotin--[acetyl-CoA-carboxylase] ligase [Candidatus Didemnitutus sp.]
MLPIDVIILRELLAPGPEPVSGTRLAKLLGISRVAVWAHLQKLVTQGFVFEAIHARGYRLTKTPATLHAALIRAHLARQRVPNFVCLESVDSTNSEAERRLAAGEAVPLIILARAQTQGRGRRGRIWHSAANGNLYSTFVFRPQLEPARLQDFTLWMGLNVCELVANFCKLQPGLKWPNDLLIDGRKAGGMLTEARVDADHVRDLIFGLGLNVNSRSADLPPDLRRTATSLADATGAPVDLNRFAAALIGRIAGAYAQFVNGTYQEKFKPWWEHYDILRGKAVTLLQGTRMVHGVASGIDAEGSLLIKTGPGTEERFRAGEVTLGKNAS